MDLETSDSQSTLLKFDEFMGKFQVIQGVGARDPLKTLKTRNPHQVTSMLLLKPS